MSNFQERPLTDTEKSEFSRCTAEAMRNLSINDFRSTPEEIVRSVDSFVDNWQDEKRQQRKKWFGRKPALPDTIDVALGLGAVWGNQIVRKFGWNWTCLQADGKDLYCIVSPDGAWVIYPTYFIKACLDNPNVDCTAMLSFNMMAANTLPEMPAKSLENFMAGIHRIIPKR